MLVGPGVNQPDPFPGYYVFVGWESPTVPQQTSDALDTGEDDCGYNKRHSESGAVSDPSQSPTTRIAGGLLGSIRGSSK